mgnify:CR=1 FL=1
MKKILVVHNKYKLLGGEDIAVDNEIDMLKNFFEVKSLIFENKKINIFSDIYSFLFNKNLKSMKMLNNEIDSFEPDLVYVHNTWYKASVAIFDILKKRNIKTFIKLHNFRYDCTRHFSLKGHFENNKICARCGSIFNNKILFNKYFEESFFKSFLILRYGKKYYRILKDYDFHLIVLTKFHKEYLINLNFDPNNIFIIPNAFESSFTDKDFKSDYLLYAGRISKEKGVQELIDSYLKSNVKTFNLKLVGSGPELKNLKKIYQNEDNVEFLGQLSNVKTKKLIAGSKAVVTSTKLFEGQPTLLCEASSLFVPSIFPRFGGIHEFFPPDSELSFEQFNYKDLVKKIKLLELGSFKQEGVNNNKYLTDHFGKNIILENMKKVFNE